MQSPLQIKPLIEQFGVDKTRRYLQQRWSKPENFFEFVSVFSNQLDSNIPPFHREIIGDVMKGGRNAFGAPRGGAKSTLVGQEFLTWVAVNTKYRFVLYISDTYYQAKLHVGALRSELEGNEMLGFVYPGLVGEKWGEEGIVVNGLGGDCYIMPLGAGMKVRGLKYKTTRPQLVIIDDLENLDVVYSAERRRKLKRWFDFDLDPALDKNNKNVVYIGTILHYHSLLKQILEKQEKYRSWRTRLYKALVDGKSFWEDRYPADYLQAIKTNPDHPDYVGSIVFAQEYQNEPQDDQDRIIKLGWLKNYHFATIVSQQEGDNHEARLKSWLKNKEVVAGVDPAISEKEQADFFAFYTYAFEESTGNEYQLDLVQEKIKDPAKQAEIIADGVEKWGISTIGIESVAYQAGLSQLVRAELQRRRIYTCRVIAIRTDKDKIRRARIHSSAFEAGFIHLRRDHEKASILLQEIEQFPLGEHDDTFDALMLGREARRRPKARVFAKNPLNK